MKTNKLLIACFLLFLTNGSRAQQKEAVLHQLNDLLINTVMEDLYNPVIASRIYVYPNLAFYECIRNSNTGSPALSGKINGLKKLPAPSVNNDHFISASLAFSWVAETLVASDYFFVNWRQHFIDSLKSNTDSNKVNESVKYGRRIADSLLSWISKDNYMRSRSMMRFVASEKQGTWQPTPNDYAPGLEPHWETIRPLTLKNPMQFSPVKKLKYSASKESEFYKNVKEVYKIGVELDSVRRGIALYWDDNPNASVIEGHLTYFIHKISPGGHWMMIAKHACIEKNIPVVKASLAYTLTSIAMFDAFIACWAEKYKTNLVRPVTMINTHIDANWKPLIQTPPFPEFTSGHSVISNAAATILTRLLGENYSFTDETEIPFGMKPRWFKSFYEAAKESSWSRVYGGIHYPETARISIEQGKTVGRHVLNTLYKP